MPYRGSRAGLNVATLDRTHRATSRAGSQMVTSAETADTPGIVRSNRVTRGAGWMAALMDLLQTAKESLPNDEARLRDLLGQAVSLIHSSSLAAATIPSLADCCFRPAGLTRWQANRVDEYIDAHMCATIRMAALASVIGLSTSYFFHAFRATFGESPYRYVVRRRIEFAKSLMITSARPLASIALESGFADQPHMTRQFKQIVGVTPAVWRRAGSLSRQLDESKALRGGHNALDARTLHERSLEWVFEGDRSRSGQDEFCSVL